ncbi:MAG: hypothetical protein WD795_00675 [Woeseia sp.]
MDVEKKLFRLLTEGVERGDDSALEYGARQYSCVRSRLIELRDMAEGKALTNIDEILRYLDFDFFTAIEAQHSAALMFAGLLEVGPTAEDQIN